MVTASPETLISELWGLFQLKRVNALPVVDRKQKLLGIVSKDDLLQALFPDMGEFVADFMGEADFEEMEKKIAEKKHLKARDLMNQRVIFTRQDTPVMRALARMIARSVNQLPVLSSENDQIVGMITKGDVFYALIKRRAPEETAAQIKKMVTKTGKKRTKPRS